jgi:hypothetical protein
VLRVATICAIAALAGCALDLDYGGADFHDDDAGDDGAGDDGAGDDEAGYADAVLADDPLLFLRFDETGGLGAEDATGNGRHGALGADVERVAGAFDGSPGAFRFTTESALVVVPDDEALRLDDGFTIELWFRIDALVGSFPGLVRKGNAGATGTGFIIFYRDGDDVQPFFKRADDTFTTSEALDEDRWYHLVVTHDAVDERSAWYIDGVQVEDDPASYPTNDDAEPLSIGRGDQGGEHSIDEVAFYDHALSEAQVAAHHAAAGVP